jgi:hypothetical protein
MSFVLFAWGGVFGEFYRGGCAGFKNQKSEVKSQKNNARSTPLKAYVFLV